MRYQVEVTIDRPRKEVLAVFVDPDQAKAWIPDLLRMERIEGEPGAKGSKTRFVFKTRRGEMEMVETVTDNALPDSFDAVYDAKSVQNIHSNRFIEEGSSTRYIADTEFKFSGMMKLMAVFMRGAFPRETRRQMELLKKHVESE